MYIWMFRISVSTCQIESLICLIISLTIFKYTFLSNSLILKDIFPHAIVYRKGLFYSGFILFTGLANLV